MQQAAETVRDKNPYKRGADDGLLMGLLLVGLFMASVYSYISPLANLIALVICLAGVPFLTFALLRRSFVKDRYLTLFSSLWMQGIVMFFCGTLILAGWTYVYLRFINPTFIVDMLNHVAATYSQTGTPAGQQIADTIETMIRQNLIPSSISLAVETIWIGVFTGSLLSAVMAAVVRMKIWRNN